MRMQSKPTKLSEQDVPGASLCGRDAKNLKIPELKQWLKCRGASVRGKKADLVARWVFVNCVYMFAAVLNEPTHELTV